MPYRHRFAFRLFIAAGVATLGLAVMAYARHDETSSTASKPSR
jgi:hypothetical protein